MFLIVRTSIRNINKIAKQELEQRSRKLAGIKIELIVRVQSPFVACNNVNLTVEIK